MIAEDDHEWNQENEDDCSDYDAAEQEKGGHVLDVSLNALSTALKWKTITIQGLLHDHTVNILLDTGSTDSYIHSSWVQRLQLKQNEVEPFSVVIADGRTITGSTVFPKVKWSIQGYQFSFDLKLMQLGGWDIILGGDWMYQYSPITFDFKELKVQFAMNGGDCTLQGSAQ